MTTIEDNYRILIIDDSPSIHDDFDKILSPPDEIETELDQLLLGVFGDGEDGESLQKPPVPPVIMTVAHAYQGEEALRMIDVAEDEGTPYAVAFVDVRMPPGWDGIETVSRIWEKHPHVEVVVCTAYSDYSWEEIVAQLGTTDQLQFIRKPVDVVSVKQMALALTRKWNLSRQSRQYTEDLEAEVQERTSELNAKVRELEKALTEIRQLQGIIPMCVYCHKVRDDDNFWQRVDHYISTHSPADVSHGICPDCFVKYVEPMLEEHDAKQQEKDAETVEQTAPAGDVVP